MDEIKPLEMQIVQCDIAFQHNLSLVKNMVQDTIQKHIGLVVTDENLKDMESTQKEIAGIRLKIDAFRKEVRKRLDEPYKQFESEINELQAIILQAEQPLKQQLQKYEDQRIAKREAELTEFAKATASTLGVRAEYFSFAVLSKWTNRTAKIGAVKKEIIDIIGTIRDRQHMDDEAVALLAQKETLIKNLCASTSATWGLVSPIQPEELQHKTAAADLGDIPGIITEECQKRLTMEELAKAPALPPEPVLDEIEAPPEATEDECQLPPEPEPPNCFNAPPAAPELTWCFVIKFPSLTAEQGRRLVTLLNSSGLPYTRVSQEAN